MTSGRPARRPAAVAIRTSPFRPVFSDFSARGVTLTPGCGLPPGRENTRGPEASTVPGQGAPGHPDRTLGVDFHPGGRQLASASWDGTVRIWDGETGEPIRLFRGPQGNAITATYSPDGTRIASAFTDGTIRIWDPADGQEVLRLACESYPELTPMLVNMVAFRPDGRWLAACSNQTGKDGDHGEVSVFDLATGRPVFTLRGHTGGIWGVTFTPDGRRIVTSGHDRTVKFRETETCQEVFTLRGHTNGVISVAFSADGRRMVTGSTDNTARIWDSMPLSEDSAP